MSSRHIHRRQLFHWIGRHIKQDRLSGRNMRNSYVEALRNSLRDGLWLQAITDEEIVLSGLSYPLRRRMVCLTENRLSESRIHAHRFGGLGLGFSKKFILSAGGKPVDYTQQKRGDLYTRSMLRCLSDGSADLQPDLDYIAHFLKPLSARRGQGARRRPASSSVSNRPAPTPGQPRRQFGPRMLHQAENEWRVVEHKRLLKRNSVSFSEGPEGRLHMAFEPGPDLFTVVFPDRQTQEIAMADKFIGTRLSGARPHISIYHLDELGEL